MFTGLIQEVGSISSVERSGGGTRIHVKAPKLSPKLKAGDSLCVNGVCLTALDIARDDFAADLAAETIRRTSLARLRPGTPVNLELPTLAGAPLGGHIVQGHVDGVGAVAALEKDGAGWRLTVELPAGLAPYVVPQGSIAIDGISLTVAKVSTSQVEMAIIPHTYHATALRDAKAGDIVNVEADVLAKYAAQQRTASKLTIEDLIADGF